MNSYKYIILFLLISFNQSALPVGVPETVASIASAATFLGTPLGLLLKTITLARTGKEVLSGIKKCAQNFFRARKSAKHVHIKADKSKLEDALLAKNTQLRTTQAVLIKQTLGMVLTLCSSWQKPAERLYALISLNRAKLLGSLGKAYRSCLATLNGNYFLEDGSSIHYDEERELPAALAEIIAHLFRILCRGKDEYAQYIQQGISKGCIQLSRKPYYKNVSIEKQGIDQSIILANKVNMDFIKVITYCAQKKWNEAHTLLESHRIKHGGTLCKPYCFIKKYYDNAKISS